MLSIALMMGNNQIMPKGPFFYVGQRFLFLVIGLSAVVSIAARRLCPQVTPILLIVPYILYAIIPSMQGWNPIISMLKIALFSVVFMAYFGLSNMVANEERTDMTKFRSVFLAFAVFYIFGSMVLLPFPAYGQLTGEEYEEAILNGQQVVSLFKGISMHSQALGPVVATINLLLVADTLFALKRGNKLYATLILCGFFLIYKSSSRAGMAAFIAGVVFMAWEAIQARGIGSRWKGKITSFFMVMFVVGLMGVVAVPAFRDGVARFALKYNPDAKVGDVTLEAMAATRQSLIDESLFYWRQKPIIGNGFQVSYEMQFRDTDRWTSLLSAPIEKGVWVTAILEEGGVVGMILIVMFIVVAGFILLRRKAYIGLGMLFTLFVSNMAEFTMFSMSAMGGFIWALIFIGSAFDALRIRDEQRGGFMRPMGMPLPMGMPPPYPPPRYYF
jgi:O-antigen ligase